MDLCYFKDHICEELDGAKDYIKQAMEIKAMNPTWTKTLTQMSAEELGHAANLYSMFMEYYNIIEKSYGVENVPEYITEMKEEVSEMYTKKSAKVRYLHDMI